MTNTFHPTIATSLGSLIQSVCNIIHKENGLNIDLPRKYEAGGELDLTLPDVLKVRPINDRGNVNEIIGKVGGADHLSEAVNQLQSLLYAA